MTKPKILICADPTDLPAAHRMKASFEKENARVTIIENYDGCMLALRQDNKMLDGMLKAPAAVVLMGTNDRGATLNEVSFRAKLLEKAMEHHTPILGIDYGMNEIVHACHGTFAKGMQEASEVVTVKGTKFAALCKRFDPMSIDNNSSPSTTHPISVRHAVSVKSPGQDLRAAAHAPGHVIEAVEANPQHRPDHFILGMQFSPEKLDAPIMEAITKRLVKEAAKPHAIEHSAAKNRVPPEPPRIHTARIFTPDGEETVQTR